MRCLTFCLTLLLALPLLCGVAGAVEDYSFFERKIRPVLVEHCYRCHSGEADSIKGGLRLDTREASRQGGDSGPAVTPGRPQDSLILEALRYESLEMPPDGQLPPEVIADFATWLKSGAPDPRDEAPSGTSSSVAESPAVDIEAGREFWSFQPPQRHSAPAVSNSRWVRKPIDAFVLARLDAAGLQPTREADRRTLIRRLSLDLTGLPPEPEAVEKFVNDNSPQAYAQMVERLLASPHYGERWARMWLDVARYAEDQAHIVGDNNSLTYPNAYRYRDWVIRALNDDLPYNEFVRMQLAADLMLPDDPSQHVALGFIGLGPKYYRRKSPEVMADEWEDRVDVVGRGLLGLTVACARCHDHKYDPIPTADYYSLAGVFASTEMFNRPLEEGGERGKDGQAKKPEQAVHIVREGEPRDLAVMIRGDVNKHGEVAPRRFLQVLCEGEPPALDSGSGRLQLAEAIVCRDNPLTARVLVNRVWAGHFGQPLVGTLSNFGQLGQRPTHPRLLDDLAVRFMENGWSLKWLHREIVLSAAYRQSSRGDSGRRQDPANRLLWRMNRKRLDVESWRDSLLAAAGRLDRTVGGRSIDPADPRETRRTVYARVSRLELNSMLALFDFPDPNAHSAGRVETTTPLQKLFVLNSPFMIRQAEGLAARLGRAASEPAERVHYAYRLLFGREASDEELRLALDYLGGDESRWRDYAQVLLASNELYVVD